MEHNLVEFAQVISWLDCARWNNPQAVAANEIYEGLQPDQKILAHWLSYITDLRRPFRQVWEEGLYVFSGLVKDYAEQQLNAGDIEKFIREHQTSPPEGKKNRPFKYGNVLYSPRYDFEELQITRTLKLLLGFDKNLVKFMLDFAERYKSDPESLRHVACALDILTYRSDSEIEIGFTENIFSSSELMSTCYRLWRKSLDAPSGHGRKRLWAALRDYFKQKGYLSHISWPVGSFELSQLELPGDKWNSEFFESFVNDLAQGAGIVTRGRNSPIIAKEIYKHVKQDFPEFYPEQLDVSFDFAPRMCEIRLCPICPFGGGRISDFCHGNSTKLCPTALITCGYILDCVPEKCPIKKGVGQKICPKTKI